MYHTYYGFRTDPFRLSPDHSFCLRHASFAKAKAYMQYALHRAEGFVMVTGAPGTGKTTLIEDLLAEAPEGEFSVARLVSVQLGADDVLRLVAYAFSIPADGLEKSELLHRLSKEFNRLYHLRRRPLLIVDEAQGLHREGLEELRLLTNMTQDGRPLLQVFLIGQEELAEIVTAPGFEQLNQRIIAACRMESLQPSEFAAYIRHRLKTAGWSGHPVFASGIFPDLYRCSQGVPRRINHICSRLLLHGALERKEQLDSLDLETVVSELRDEHYLTNTGGTLFGLDRFDADDLRMLAELSLTESDAAGVNPSGLTEQASEFCDAPDSLPRLGQDQIIERGLAAHDRVEISRDDYPLQPPTETVEERESLDLRKVPSRLAPAYLAPLWGTAAAAVLCLVVMLVVLLSAPEHQFQRLSSHAVWEDLGVAVMRSRIFRMTKGHWPIGGQFKRGAELEPLAPALLAMHSGTLRLAKTKVQVPQTAGGAVAASRQAAMKLDLPTTAVPGVK